MEHIKTVETTNFRVICEPAGPATGVGPATGATSQIKVQFYGNSEDGLKFCASDEAMKLVESIKGGTLPNMIRGYETMLPAAKFMGYLDKPEVLQKLKSRTSTVLPTTPAPAYQPNPMDSLSPVPVQPASVQPVRPVPGRTTSLGDGVRHGHGR